MPPKRVRNWVMTLNNYSKEEQTQIHNTFEKFCDKYIIGEEIGSKEETPHLQMWAQFKNARTFERVKAINSRMHIEQAKGDAWHNRNYCSKERDDYTKVYAHKGMDDVVSKQVKEQMKQEENDLLERHYTYHKNLFRGEHLTIEDINSNWDYHKERVNKLLKEIDGCKFCKHDKEYDERDED